MSDVSVVEGNRGQTDAVFTITLSRPRTVATSGCAAAFGETATVGDDVDFFVGCGTIAAGQTQMTVAVPVRGDRRKEPDETFGLLVVPGSGTRGGDLVGRATIRNDD